MTTLHDHPVITALETNGIPVGPPEPDRKALDAKYEAALFDDKFNLRQMVETLAVNAPRLERIHDKLTARLMRTQDAAHHVELAEAIGLLRRLRPWLTDCVGMVSDARAAVG